MPTEEVFSAPHKDRADGTVTATKPLSHQGTMIEGIHVRFERGRIVELKATKGEEVLKKLIETDDGARRLGRSGAGAAFVAHRIQRAGVFQHPFRRECRVAYRAGSGLFRLPARWRQADPGSACGQGRERQPDSCGLDDRIGQIGYRRRYSYRRGRATHAARRMGVREVPIEN